MTNNAEEHIRAGQLRHDCCSESELRNNSMPTHLVGRLDHLGNAHHTRLLASLQKCSVDSPMRALLPGALQVLH